jgi:hypothetical protein
MTTLVWDQIGQRKYETGVDRGVLYIPNNLGVYTNGVAWNGLTNVNETPSGAEANAQYADNIKYLNLFSAEEFGATLEAYTYPDEFAQYDGLGTPAVGVVIGQQARKSFGLSYRTKIGNDVDGDAHGYKLHLVYGCSASPSEKSYSTINDSPEAITFSWDITTVPVPVTGFRPTSILVVDSTKVTSGDLTDLEALLYGTPGTDPSLPSPDAVISIFSGSQTLATPTQPAYNSTTKVITIPSITGVTYYRDDVAVAAGEITITADTVIEARPNVGYVFPPVIDTDWFFDY